MGHEEVTDLAITGVGITAAVGQGRDAFASALMSGAHAFRVMERPGRQHDSAFLGAEIPTLAYPADIAPAALRTASFSAQVAVITLHEAWRDAGLHEVDPTRIGLIVGGSNFQQRDLVQTQGSYAGRTQFLRPTYGLSFMDTDLCGICSAQFGIRGLAYTVGGASASGQLAIVQAVQAVRTHQVDVCIALGALMDLSYWECQGLRALGAMGSDRYAEDPASSCRPFDRDRDGFIYGESCGAVVIERIPTTARRPLRPYAWISGWGVAIDGNRNPNPSLDGEVRAIRSALQQAACASENIDYINPHGTGSRVGDETELNAIQACGLSRAWMNATKSITGHGLSASGTVEVIATVLQMQAGRLHPTRNLEHPIDASINWVGATPVSHAIENALTLSMGFGGINTALCLRRYQ
jgi:malonyl-ACP decarboxylase